MTIYNGKKPKETGYKFIMRTAAGHEIIVSYDREGATIPTLLELFGDFLRACGYSMERGTYLELVEEPSSSKKDDE